MRSTKRQWLMGLVGLAALVAAGCAPLTGLVRPWNRPPAQTASFQLGPFNLAAMGQPGFESNTTQANVPRPVGNIGIRSMAFDIVDAQGVPVGKHDVHLHHVLLMTSAREDVLCPGRAERFGGSGSERTPITLPSDYAYLSAASERWSSLWHIMNESNIARTVYIKYTIGYDTGVNSSNARPVTPYFLDQTGCGGSTFDVPGNGGPGSVYTRTRTFVAPEDGVAVFTGGHLHEGGIDNTLSRESTGQVACVSTVTYHENPRHVDKINPCTLHHSVEAGESYRLTTRYENHEPIEDAMGINLTYVWHGTPPPA